MGHRRLLKLGARCALAILACGAAAHGQTPPAAAPAPSAQPPPETATAEAQPDALALLRKELAAQRAELEAQRELGYFAYISNGRTPGEVSLTEDKMVGGRLFARHRGLRLTLGVSGYTLRNVVQEQRVDTGATIGATAVTVYDQRESAVGLDLSFDNGPLRLRSEFTVRAVRAAPGKHPLYLGIQGLHEADRNDWDGYLLGAWQLPWLGIEPFLFVEAFHFFSPTSDGALIGSAGFNVHFNPAVQLKLQWASGFLFEDFGSLRRGAAKNEDSQVVTTRLVVAF